MRCFRPGMLGLLLTTLCPLTMAAPDKTAAEPKKASIAKEIEQDSWFLMLMGGKRAGSGHESRCRHRIGNAGLIRDFRRPELEQQVQPVGTSRRKAVDSVKTAVGRDVPDTLGLEEH